MPASWDNQRTMVSKSFICGHCGNRVGSDKGFSSQRSSADKIYICPNCNEPTCFNLISQVPEVTPGNEVGNLPDVVSCLYKETRKCVSVQAYTASVLASRKLLMNIAVAEGAKENKSFIYYVEYLAENGFVPPNGRGWVDHIRRKGNEATHEIELMERDEALELIFFSEMLLKFIYEFPAKVPQA